MTDEEKKVVEWLKQSINEYNDIFQGKIQDEAGIKRMKTLLNLIKKQSKEIEELKEELEIYKIYTKQEDLQDFDLFIKQKYITKEESEAKERKAYIKGTNDAHELCNKKWKDKIKAKIEEYKKQQKEEPDAYLCIKVLQSLLKE